MKRTTIGGLLLAAALTAIAASATETMQPNDRIFKDCEVFPEDEAVLSAEEAGVLVKLIAKDGTTARTGELLAQIDTRQAEFQMQAAKHGFDAANERFTSPIEIDYAKAASEVARTELRMLEEANRQSPNSVAQIEIEKAKLQWNTTELQIKKAEHDKKLAGFDMNVKAAEHELGKLGVERRLLRAPYDGVVVQLRRHQHEWVNPGDPILHYMRLDKMRVERRIPSDQFDPHEVADRRVTVEVTLARGRTATFTGRITYVSPQLDFDNNILVRAEVDNRQEQGHWILRPNSQASMTIHLAAPPAEAGGQRGR